MKKKLLALLLATVILIQFTGCGNDKEKLNTINNAGLTVNFLETGKSDCILIRMDDLNIVIDTADADDYSHIKESLDNKGIGKIDYMILTHLDKDHIGSAAQIITNYEVNTVIKPDYEESSETYEMLKATLENNTETELLNLSELYKIDTELGSVTIYPPHEDDYKDVNNFSLITSLKYGDKSILFTGDALKKRMEEFLEECNEHFDIIKTPHHGDYYKALGKLLDAASPDYCIETVEYVDFVEQGLLDKTEENGIELFYTCNGTITVTSNGTDLNISQ